MIWGAYTESHWIMRQMDVIWIWMSIIGVTIDYGPFGFVQYFYDEFVANHWDCNTGYPYKQQSGVCLWNVDQLALSLDELNIISYDIDEIIKLFFIKL